MAHEVVNITSSLLVRLTFPVKVSDGQRFLLRWPRSVVNNPVWDPAHNKFSAAGPGSAALRLLLFSKLANFVRYQNRSAERGRLRSVSGEASRRRLWQTKETTPASHLPPALRSQLPAPTLTSAYYLARSHNGCPPLPPHAVAYTFTDIGNKQRGRHLW